MRVRPFEGALVRADAAAAIVAPAYDALTGAERRVWAAAHPRSWLNALHAPDDWPPGESPAADALLEANRAYVEERVAAGEFADPGGPALYVYRMESHGHAQSGVVGAVPIEEDARGRIRHHEFTRPERVAVLADYLGAVGVMSSPVCLAYRSRPGIDAEVRAVERAPPAVRHVAEDGSVHSVWPVAGAAAARLAALFEPLDRVYITDGHHRTMAAGRFARERAHPDLGLLAVLLPHDRLRVLGYHRCVRDLAGLGPGAFLGAIGRRFEVEPAAHAEEAVPRRVGEMAMLLDGGWFRLTRSVVPAGAPDPVAGLDAAVLQSEVLGPLLGIEDPRTDPRLAYAPGALGLAGLADRAQSGWRLGFALHPVPIEDLLAVADADAVMPPKSTWFDPKARSGLFLLRV